MGKKLYIGNLPYSATEDELRELFEQHGPVESVDVITDRATGRSRGFAFVEMEAAQADAAMEALNGHDMGDRQLHVSEARERREGGDGGQRRAGRF